MWHGPELVGWLLVALCAGTGGYCLGWAAGGPGSGRPSAVADGAMGLGMAAMAVPGVPVAHGSFASVSVSAGFAAFFTGVAAWVAVLPGAGGAQRAHHVLESLAMVYAALAMTVAAAGGGHASAGLPPLTALLLVYLAMYLLTGTAPRLVPAGGGPPPGPPGAGRPPRAPEVVAACRLALGLGTLAMLVTL
ncbi:DUF5134 domain-containing protein [Streptomyces sp. B6B3]|uniref:DUF5134 domain-containing protein n=1 Tax=Streptomyces sp. B6B3 TaxID=3153570 RepID=UPI00325E65F2